MPCGDAAFNPPCNDDLPCGGRLTPNGDASACVPCGGLNDPICNVEGSDERPCDSGLTRSNVKVEEFVVAEDGTGAVCTAETVAQVESAAGCGNVGERPCLEGEAQQPCKGRATPTQDGLQCIVCGGLDEAPCAGEKSQCSGQLIILMDANNEPQLCVNSTTLATAQAPAPAGVLDQSGGGAAPCGLAGQPWCNNGGPVCLGRTAIVGRTCEACGGIKQPVCSGVEGSGDIVRSQSGGSDGFSGIASPCDPGLRQEGSSCVACGARGEKVCASPIVGDSGCDEGLSNIEGFCLKPEDSGAQVRDQSGGGDPPPPPEPTAGCGLEGADPCPGQPACGTGLYLVVADDVLKCSADQPGMLPAMLFHVLPVVACFSSESWGAAFQIKCVVATCATHAMGAFSEVTTRLLKLLAQLQEQRIPLVATAASLASLSATTSRSARVRTCQCFLRASALPACRRR